MILDQAADLKRLASQATSAAEHSNVDAALAAVHHEFDVVDRSLAGYGVAHESWLQHLSDATRSLLHDRAGILAHSLAPLQGLSDQEMAVYGLDSQADTRGQISAVRREAQALREALAVAQAELLEGWLERVWPRADAAKLHVLAHLPTTRQVAATVLHFREELSARMGDASPRLPQNELQRLADKATEAERLADALRAEDVPGEIVEFWRAVEEEGGIPLERLSRGTHEWLLAHDAAGQFMVLART